MSPASERKCSRCGKIGNGNIHVHHKDTNPNNNSLTNLIYLCSSCHRLWHSGKWSYERDGLTNVHLTELPVPSPLDRTVIIAEDAWQGLIEYASVERARVKDSPVFAAMITPKSLVQHIVRNELQKRHYYPREAMKKGGK